MALIGPRPYCFKMESPLSKAWANFMDNYSQLLCPFSSFFFKKKLLLLFFIYMYISQQRVLVNKTDVVYTQLNPCNKVILLHW
jgi:hypothetical protein